MKATMTKVWGGYTLTKAAALKIQADQLQHYAPMVPYFDLAGYMASRTTADRLPDEGDIDMKLINQNIPRGADFEYAIADFRAGKLNQWRKS